MRLRMLPNSEVTYLFNEFHPLHVIPLFDGIITEDGRYQTD